MGSLSTCHQATAQALLVLAHRGTGHLEHLDSVLRVLGEQLVTMARLATGLREEEVEGTEVKKMVRELSFEMETMFGCIENILKQDHLKNILPNDDFIRTVRKFGFSSECLLNLLTKKDPKMLQKQKMEDFMKSLNRIIEECEEEAKALASTCKNAEDKDKYLRKILESVKTAKVLALTGTILVATFAEPACNQLLLQTVDDLRNILQKVMMETKEINSTNMNPVVSKDILNILEEFSEYAEDNVEDKIILTANKVIDSCEQIMVGKNAPEFIANVKMCGTDVKALMQELKDKASKSEDIELQVIPIIQNIH